MIDTILWLTLVASTTALICWLTIRNVKLQTEVERLRTAMGQIADEAGCRDSQDADDLGGMARSAIAAREEVPHDEA